jgi:septal ring factor EnvC (AmiA/AmiB activator)
MREATPREIELSKALARSTAENARVAAQLSEVPIENRLLRKKIDALVQRLFAAQSEKLDAAQLLLDAARLRCAGKIPGARGSGGTTALDSFIASA